MIALLTITPIDTGDKLIFFYEYREFTVQEIGVTADGKKVHEIADRFKERADKRAFNFEVFKRPMLRLM